MLVVGGTGGVLIDFLAVGLSSKVEVHKLKPRVRRSNLRGTYHETLQRIDPSSEHHNHYQQHWFSGGLEVGRLEEVLEVLEFCCFRG